MFNINKICRVFTNCLEKKYRFPSLLLFPLDLVLFVFRIKHKKLNIKSVRKENPGFGNLISMANNFVDIFLETFFIPLLLQLYDKNNVNKLKL